MEKKNEETKLHQKDVRYWFFFAVAALWGQVL